MGPVGMSTTVSLAETAESMIERSGEPRCTTPRKSWVDYCAVAVREQRLGDIWCSTGGRGRDPSLFLDRSFDIFRNSDSELSALRSGGSVNEMHGEETHIPMMMMSSHPHHHLARIQARTHSESRDRVASTRKCLTEPTQPEIDKHSTWGT